MTSRVLLTVGVLVLLAAGSRAGENVVRLRVQPMAAPKPALKYPLLPELRELRPGNPVHGYLRCFGEQQNFFFGKGAVEERARYQTAPLAELKAAKVADYGGRLLRDIDWAARHDTVDWQLLPRVQSEGMDLPLPALANLQVLAAALHVRLRGQVAHQCYDDAVASAKTLFALARQLGDYPAEVGNLLGLSVAELTCDALFELVQQPGCPNLYWALTDLPCPLVELRKGMHGDALLVANDLRPLRDDEAMTDEQVEAVVKRLSGVLSFIREQSGRPPRSLRAELKARLSDTEGVVAARKRLVAAGLPEERVRKFSAVQVVLLDERRGYELQRDEALKLLTLAPWQIDALGAPSGRGCGLLADLVPDAVASRRTQARLEQRLGLLRHVEALRLYAAGHEGRLPERLADVKLPLPLDPFTGRALEYEVSGATAHLRGGDLHCAVTLEAR